jgi:DNA adenine methylase
MPVANRIKDWQIEHKDAIDIIQRYDAVDTFFYIDPPYMQSERCEKRYKVDCSDIEHLTLLLAIEKVKGMILLSGYDNDMYCKHLNGWFKKQYTVYCKAVGNTRMNNVIGEGIMDEHKRVEMLWYNYPEPEGRLF